MRLRSLNGLATALILLLVTCASLLASDPQISPSSGVKTALKAPVTQPPVTRVPDGPRPMRGSISSATVNWGKSDSGFLTTADASRDWRCAK